MAQKQAKLSGGETFPVEWMAIEMLWVQVVHLE